MISAAYGTVGDIEVAWVLIALIGLVYSIVNIQEGRKDLQWLHANSIANGRRTLARYQLVAECLRTAIQLIFIAIGVLAMILPEPPPAHDLSLPVILGFVIRWGLIASSVMLTIKSYLGKRVRDVLRGR